MRLKSFQNLALTGVGFVGVPALSVEKARTSAVEYISAAGGAIIRKLDSVLGYVATVSRPEARGAAVFDMRAVGASVVEGKIVSRVLSNKNPFIGARLCPSCYEKEHVVLSRGEAAGTCPKCKQHFSYLYTALPPFCQYYTGADSGGIGCVRDSEAARVADRLKIAFFKCDPVSEFKRPSLYAEVKPCVAGSKEAKELSGLVARMAGEELVRWANGAVLPKTMSTVSGVCSSVVVGERGLQVSVRGATNTHKFMFPAHWVASVAEGDRVRLWQELATPLPRVVYPDDPWRKPHSAQEIYKNLKPAWRARLLRDIGLHGAELDSQGLPNDRRGEGTGVKLYPARWFANCCKSMISKYWVSYIGCTQGSFVVEQNPAEDVVLPAVG